MIFGSRDMGDWTAAVRPQSGAIATALAALAGFAAGALVMGILTVGRGPSAAEQVPAQMLIQQGSEWPQPDPSGSPNEATPPAAPLGGVRADRLRAP
jgi:hypothetical protein